MEKRYYRTWIPELKVEVEFDIKEKKFNYKGNLQEWKEDLTTVLYDDKEQVNYSMDEQENILPDEMSIVWSIEDVLFIAENDHHEISEDDAREILRAVMKSHDAEYGITWDSIRSEISDFMETRERAERSRGEY